MRSDDVKLIQRTLVGDEDAFANLVKKYQKQIHMYAWRKRRISTSPKILHRDFPASLTEIGNLARPSTV